MPSSSGVRTTVAPSPRISLHFPSANCSGTYSITLYPRFTPISANPTPVFPAVASTIVPPACNTPRRSASSTIPSAALSLMLPPGFRYSSFAQISAQLSAPLACSSRRSRTIGVCPTSSKILSTTFINPLPHNTDRHTPSYRQTGISAAVPRYAISDPTLLVLLTGTEPRVPTLRRIRDNPRIVPGTCPHRQPSKVLGLRVHMHLAIPTQRRRLRRMI